MRGHEAIIQFLTKKWQKEKGYKLRKDLFAFTDNKIAVQVRSILFVLIRSLVLRHVSVHCGCTAPRES